MEPGQSADQPPERQPQKPLARRREFYVNDFQRPQSRPASYRKPEDVLPLATNAAQAMLQNQPPVASQPAFQVRDFSSAELPAQATDTIPTELLQSVTPLDAPPAEPDTSFQLPATVPKAPSKLKTKLRQLVAKKPSASQLRQTTPLAAAAVAVLVVVGGLFGLVHAQQARDSPDRVMHDALVASMSVTKLQKTTLDGAASSVVNYNFADPKNPVVDSTAIISQNGSEFKLSGYGTAQNTYISYQALPTTIAPSLSNLIKGGWVQLRANGSQPNDVSPSLATVADPRFQSFGPVLFGNYSAALREQLTSYLQTKAYQYDPKAVVKTKLNDQKAYVFSIKPNVGYLKIANQSALSGNGASLADIQTAAASLDELNGATMKLYISTKGHQVVQTVISHGNVIKTISYAQTKLPAIASEPQTKLAWQNFMPAQLQLEAEAASHQPSGVLDGLRKANLDSLHTRLANYYNQNSSYPSGANLNTAAWLTNNFIGFDPDSLRDPLAPNRLLVTSPKANAYAYQAVGSDPSLACNNTAANPCLHYKLLATLSNGQQYSVQDP